MRPSISNLPDFYPGQNNRANSINLEGEVNTLRVVFLLFFLLFLCFLGTWWHRRVLLLLFLGGGGGVDTFFLSTPHV